MPYYSTDSDEHRENIGLGRSPDADDDRMDLWIFESPIYPWDEDNELDPEVEAHNDEVMAGLQYYDHITDVLNNDF